MRTAVFTPPGPRRLHLAIAISLLAHALLLSLTLGGEAFGLPGLYFPWEERRFAANDLRVSLAPAQPKPAAAAAAQERAAPAPAPDDTATPILAAKRSDTNKPATMTLPEPAAQEAAPAAAPPAPAPAPPPAPPTPPAERPAVTLPNIADTQAADEEQRRQDAAQAEQT
ncbi:MAG TPA: hypothetical protein DDZ22_18515, partial [Massilia sp.]|nr:hypothetical protein [Massilia sp.]